MRSTKLVLTSKQKSITYGVKNIQHDMKVVVITQLELFRTLKTFLWNFYFIWKTLKKSQARQDSTFDLYLQWRKTIQNQFYTPMKVSNLRMSKIIVMQMSSFEPKTDNFPHALIPLLRACNKQEQKHDSRKVALIYLQTSQQQ